NARIHLVLGHIDADDNNLILCHHPLPSLLVPGSKPLQLFGLRKTPELSLALIQALSPLVATGSVPATGGWCAAARSHILTGFLDTSGRSTLRRPRILDDACNDTRCPYRAGRYGRAKMATVTST